MGNDEHLRKAFEFFDKDQNGYIEIDELRDALADEIDENSEEIIYAIIHDVDTNKVGLTFLSTALLLVVRVAHAFPKLCDGFILFQGRYVLC